MHLSISLISHMLSLSLFQDLLKSLRGTATVVFITHDLTAANIADRVIVLGEGGKLIEEGPREKLLTVANGKDREKRLKEILSSCCVSFLLLCPSLSRTLLFFPSSRLSFLFSLSHLFSLFSLRCIPYVCSSSRRCAGAGTSAARDHGHVSRRRRGRCAHSQRRT